MEKIKSPSIYPCRFPVKVIGECSAEFEADVMTVMRGHVENLSPEGVARKVSGGGKYLSLTIYIIARDREHLESVYAELKARQRVLMVL